MSRKHYREVAENIAYEVRLLGGLTPVRRLAKSEVIEQWAGSMALMFKHDNSNFRYDTFFEACGLDAYGKVVKSK